MHAIDHTPDFLALTDKGIVLEEWKSWEKLEGLARRNPWRYQLGPDDRWQSAPMEKWLAERGIGYRLRTNRDISDRRLENILLLEDFFHPSAPSCPVEVELKIRELLVAEPVLYLAELYNEANCRVDDVMKLIADGLLVVDLDATSITEPNRCRAFRDLAVRDFELARLQSEPFPLQCAFDIREGTRMLYRNEPYTLTMVGSDKVALSSADGRLSEILRGNLEQLIAEGNAVMDVTQDTSGTKATLSEFTEAELRMALKRKEAMLVGNLPRRTLNRLQKLVAQAKASGIDELVVLVPRTRDRGNRLQRLSVQQEDLMAQVIREDHLTSRAPNKKSSYRKLATLCNEAGIDPPSYPTLLMRIRALPQKVADLARHGKRVAYKNQDFVLEIHADTPVHGSRPFQYVHMDHTELDIEVVCSRTGKSLGRVWLSLAIDAFTRRILGIYLSFDPPSYRSNMMLLRDIVRRHRRLPQFIVVDNGADFRSGDFEIFTKLFGIHVRYRPAGKPRYGSVMERIFGTVHTQYVHNLAGNTKALKKVRETTGKFLPSRLAEWNLEWLYYGVEHWAFEFYDAENHSTLGISPREAFARGMTASGERAHRVITLSKDFLVLSCPSAERQGQRKVDRQRGIKLHDRYYYWCPEFRDPKVAGTKVPVKYDPWNASIAYVQVGRKWVAAHCKALAALGQMTEIERKAISNEYVTRYPNSGTDELSTQRLSEFLRVFTPSGAMELHLLRQQENRYLYRQLGIGAVPQNQPIPMLELAANSLTPPVVPVPTNNRDDSQPTVIAIDDTPDFDTF